jgi:hypothetical protein
MFSSRPAVCVFSYFLAKISIMRVKAEWSSQKIVQWIFSASVMSSLHRTKSKVAMNHLKFLPVCSPFVLCS